MFNCCLFNNNCSAFNVLNVSTYKTVNATISNNNETSSNTNVLLLIIVKSGRNLSIIDMLSNWNINRCCFEKIYKYLIKCVIIRIRRVIICGYT